MLRGCNVDVKNCVAISRATSNPSWSISQLGGFKARSPFPARDPARGDPYPVFRPRGGDRRERAGGDLCRTGEPRPLFAARAGDDGPGCRQFYQFRHPHLSRRCKSGCFATARKSSTPSHYCNSSPMSTCRSIYSSTALWRSSATSCRDAAEQSGAHHGAAEIAGGRGLRRTGEVIQITNGRPLRPQERGSRYRFKRALIAPSDFVLRRAAISLLVGTMNSGGGFIDPHFRWRGNASIA